MKRLLVHFHIYYHEQVDYFIQKMKNISGVEWDLVVTFSQRNEETVSKLDAFKPGVKYMELENLGYDIWPFIHVVKNTALGDYDYVIKIHTKREVRKCAANVIPLKGYQWRDALVDGMLFSRSHFQKILTLFRENPGVGMVSNLVTYSKRNWDTYAPRIAEELSRLGLESRGNHFCMGTMFMARSEVLLPLQSPKITPEIFIDTIADKERDFKSAHYYERLISVLPQAQNMEHRPVVVRKKEKVLISLARFIEVPFRWAFSIEKKGPEKRKFIRILGLEFYIQPPKNRA